MSDGPFCPRCGGEMKDRRAVKRFVKAADWVCKDQSCFGAIYLENTTTTEKQGT